MMKKFSKSQLFAIAVFAANYFCSIVRAEPVYSWTDAEGKLHFSTAAEHPNAKSSELPELHRENIDRRIKDIREQTPNNCIEHAGVDCSQGADKDGSVICFDGFRDAIATFQSECTQVRLEMRFAVLVEGREEPLKHSRNLRTKLKDAVPQGFYLSIRNLSNTAAENVVVSYILAGKRRVTVEGPSKVDAFGNADYTLRFENLPKPLTTYEIERSGYEVQCSNCGAVLSNRY